MLRVLYRDLRHNLITPRKPTSSLILLHFSVLYNNNVVVVQKYQNPFLKFISSNIIPESKNPQSSITVDYLVNSCGLPPNKALSLANKKKFNICSVEKADSVISLLESYGLTKTHITKIIYQHPHLLLVDPKKLLKPKFDFLSDLGVSEPDLTKLIASHPRLLTSSLNNQIIPSFNFLKTYVDNDAGIMKLLKRWPAILRINLEKVLKPNIAILQIHGVPNHKIARLLITDPITLTGNYNRFKEIAEKVKNMGFDPSSTMFVKAVATMTGINKSIWDKKLMVYREFGWLENDVISAFKKHPNCMRISEENIRRSMKFFVEKLKCQPTDILSRPTLLLYSVEKRIIPRCAVLKILYSKGIIDKKLNLFSVFLMAEKDFSEKFVIIYRESVPEVMKAYKGETEFVGFEEVVQLKGFFIKPGLIAV